MAYLSLLRFGSWPVAIVHTILVTMAAEVHSTKTSCSFNSTASPILPRGIPIFNVPNLYAPATNSQPADTVAQILNTLSLYPLAIDGKNFPALSLVFAPNVIANFSAPVGVLTPLPAVQKGLEQILAPVDSQHSYGTQIVDVLDDCHVRSVSYFTASQFGKGKYYGQVSCLRTFNMSSPL